jgi:hypothetical protein
LFGRWTRRVWVLWFLLAMFAPSALAQLTFRRAAELAQSHSETDSTESLCNADIEASHAALLRVAMNARFTDPINTVALSGIPVPLLQAVNGRTFSDPSLRMDQAPVSPILNRRQNLLWCALTTYAELAQVASQTKVVERQRTAVDRLLDVESRRVVKKLDEPVGLIRARYFAARTQLSEARLKAAERHLQEKLAMLTGLQPGEVGVIAGAIPSPPETFNDDVRFQSTVLQLASARDVAQLAFVLAVVYRDSIRVKIVLGRAHFSELLIAYVIEEESLEDLYEMVFELQRAQMYQLLLSGGLEQWALGNVASEPAADTSPIHSDSTDRPALQADGEARTTVTVRSLMITPGISSLATGHSQQFSAIAVHGDGTATDMTSKSIWRCSGSEAIVSTSGLVTALSTGKITINASFSGVSKSRQISITADEWTPWNSEP